jgi:hypothetical protein
MHTPSISQMAARANSGHVAWLKAYNEGRTPKAQRAGDARGLMTCRDTLLKWGAIDGDQITDVGRALLRELTGGAWLWR